MRQAAEIPFEDVAAITELQLMTKIELERVDFKPYRSYCSHEGCGRYTTLKDFGAEPFFWSRQVGWVDLSNQKFYCGTHLHHLRK